MAARPEAPPQTFAPRLKLVTMKTLISARSTAAFIFCASTATLTACNGSSTLTPVSRLATPTPTATPSTVLTTATPAPTATASATARASATPISTPTPTASPTAAPTATPTAHPSATPTPTPTPTPAAVASQTATGTSRVDGSNPADIDINLATGVTLPSGDTFGLVYFVGSTNATGTSPVATTYFFLSNPGSFPVTGRAVVALQSVFTDSPSVLAFATDRLTELDVEYNVVNEANPILAPGSSYTCTIFDGRTLIGSDVSTVGGSTTGGLANAYASCTGQYPDNSYPSNYGNGHAFVNLPATYNSGDVYTYIISQ
jgi:hypothetical protein